MEKVPRAVGSSALLLQESSVEILNYVGAIAIHEWIQVLRCGNDIVHMDTAVVEHNISQSEFRYH